MSAGRPHNYSFCVSRRVRAARAGPVTATTAHGEGIYGNVVQRRDEIGLENGNYEIPSLYDFAVCQKSDTWHVARFLLKSVTQSDLFNEHVSLQWISCNTSCPY